MIPPEPRRGLPGLVAGAQARDLTGETAACDQLLRLLLEELGDWSDYVVLIGGLTPRHLVPEPPAGIDPHVGTTDVDLVLTLAVPAETELPDETLAHRLLALGFEPRPETTSPGGPAFRWTRRTMGFKVKVEFMCPANDREGGQIEPDPLPNTGAELGALRLPGAELVSRDYREVRLAGPQSEGSPQVILRVAGLLPFLVLKAFALDEREKDKDAYDVVWVLSALGDGPGDAARMALASPVAGESVVEKAIARLREHFGTRDSRGSELYAQMFPNQPVVERRVLQRHAHTTVSEFLKVWDAERR
ncbi:MAG: hypothetical protein ACJ8GN_12655 [Longimicrobiaceae bacterium]